MVAVSSAYRFHIDISTIMRTTHYKTGTLYIIFLIAVRLPYIFTGTPCFIAYTGIPCLIGGPKDGAVDIVCKVIDSKHQCKNPIIAWNKNSFRIKNSDKFGIWFAEWGISKAEHVSLLRIRNYNETDIGSYTCQVVCDNNVQFQRHAQTCILDSKSGLLLCNKNAKDVNCRAKFQNGVCDQECNSTAQLLDGYDCQPSIRPCNSNYDRFCLQRYGNAHCDRPCSSIECGFDAGDCESNIQDSFTPRENVLITVINLSEPALKNVSRTFIRRITYALRTALLVLNNDLSIRTTDVIHNIYQWNQDLQAVYYYINNTTNVNNHENSQKSIIHFKLGICNIPGACFDDVTAAARYLNAVLQQNDLVLGIPVCAIGVLTSLEKCKLQESSLLDNVPNDANNSELAIQDETKGSTPENVDVGIYIGSSLGFVAIVILIIGITCIVKYNAKHSRDRLDAPEGCDTPPSFEEGEQIKDEAYPYSDPPSPTNNQKSQHQQNVDVEGTISSSAC